MNRSLPHVVVENSWHRYDMKNFPHCRPVYSKTPLQMPATESVTGYGRPM